MSSILHSGSYVQAERHSALSQRYNPIQASAVGDAMIAHGLTLATLSTGKAKHEDKRDHQRTLARYRGPALTDGTFLDLIHDGRKLGRGVDHFFLGVYRIVCTNGIWAGKTYFDYSVRHTGLTYDSLNQGIESALNQRKRLGQTIELMQGYQTTRSDVITLEQSAIRHLTPVNAEQVISNLNTVHRSEDNSTDLWTTFNRIQENAMMGGQVSWTQRSKDAKGKPIVFQASSRPIKSQSGKDASFNQSLFDAAMRLTA